MTVTPHVYVKASLSLATKLIDLTADDIRVMLLGTYTLGTTLDDAQFVADVLAAATETVGTGYTSGGLALSSSSFTENSPAYVLDCDDLVWASATFPDARYALVYDNTPGSDATNPVICLFDFGGNFPATGGDYTLPINASGLLNLIAS